MRQLRRYGTLGTMALIGIVGLLVVGCHKDETTETTPAPTTTPKSGDTGVAGGPTGGPGGPMSMPGGPGRGSGGRRRPGGAPPVTSTGMPGDPFAQRGGATPGVPTDQQIAMAPLKSSRDPFFVTWTRPLPPPNPFDEVQPLRVASVDQFIPSSKPIQVREVSDRRVSGIMSGDGVYAIIERGGESEVVKPGGMTSDGYRVISINGDSVKLERKDGNIIRTQIVQLSDAQTGVQTAGFGGNGAPGFGAGRPGFGGGRPGFGQGPGGGRPGLPGAGTDGGGKD